MAEPARGLKVRSALAAGKSLIAVAAIAASLAFDAGAKAQPAPGPTPSPAAWGSYHTEFYPTYDYKPTGLASHERAQAK